jgi:DNA-binding CsgD family transcriptional regulator
MARPERISCMAALAGRAAPSAAVTGRTKTKDDFLEQLQQKPLNVLEAALASLTHQERVVLDFIVRGACNKDICNSLNIEITTAKAHTSRIFKKLGVKNRVQAAVFGLWTSLLMRASKDDASPLPPGTVHREDVAVRAPGSLSQDAVAAVPLSQ